MGRIINERAYNCYMMSTNSYVVVTFQTKSSSFHVLLLLFLLYY